MTRKADLKVCSMNLFYYPYFLNLIIHIKLIKKYLNWHFFLGPTSMNTSEDDTEDKNTGKCLKRTESIQNEIIVQLNYYSNIFFILSK